MIAAAACLHLLRVTLEAVTPLSLGSGESRGVERDGARVKEGMVIDLMRDANGLPTIPGSSLQGGVRTFYRAAYGDKVTKELFGCAKGDDGAGGDDGAAGKLLVGFGFVHDASDVAVTGLRMNVRQDAILDLLVRQEPLRRDHVALDHRHVVDDRKKFERLAVPRGTRFSFEMGLWGTLASRDADIARLKRIADLLRDPAFRIGGASRRGYGQVRPIRMTYGAPDLRNAAAMRDLRRQPPSTALAQDWLKAEPSGSGSTVHTIATLTLTPINPWRVGGGSADGVGQQRRWRNPPLTPNTRGSRAFTKGTRSGAPGASVNHPRPDLAAAPPVAMTQGDVLGKDDTRDTIAAVLREPVITWAGGRGLVRRVSTPADDALATEDFVVPGSAIKGPLAHRTVFHWHRAKGMFADADSPKTAGAPPSPMARPDGLKALLGAAKERPMKESASSSPPNASSAADPGRAARLLVEDGAVAGVTDVIAFDHNVIDRFTGGVMDQLFHTEEALIGGTIRVRLIIAPCDDTGSHWPGDVVAAFCNALSDLCRGRLTIGAKSLGFCDGTVAWSGRESEIWAAAFTAAPGGRKAA